MAETARVLVLSGVDSSGGAGQAVDLSVLDIKGVPGVGVPTAQTLQSDQSVQEVVATDELEFRARIADVTASGPITAIKIGLIPSVPILDAVAELLADLKGSPVVYDPVFRASSGGMLMSSDSFDSLESRLSGLVTVLTPNSDEAELLSGQAVNSLADSRKICTLLAQRWQSACVLKGGHWGDGDVVDVLCDGDIVEFSANRLDVQRRGTGCRFASALAAELACGASLSDGVLSARALVREYLISG